jgi:hypothetical protein
MMAEVAARPNTNWKDVAGLHSKQVLQEVIFPVEFPQFFKVSVTPSSSSTV